MANGGKQAENTRALILAGEEISVKHYRTFMLTAIIGVEEQQKKAAEERMEIKTTLEEKIECLEEQINTQPVTSCTQAATNLLEIDRIRDDEIPALRIASRITDVIVLAITSVLGYLGLK